MTSDQLFKYKFHAYMRIYFVYPRTAKAIECSLIGIDFDTHCLKLEPVKSSRYEQETFWANCLECEFRVPLEILDIPHQLRKIT